MLILWKASHIACNIHNYISPYWYNPKTSLYHHSSTNTNDSFKYSFFAKCSFFNQHLPLNIVPFPTFLWWIAFSISWRLFSSWLWTRFRILIRIRTLSFIVVILLFCLFLWFMSNLLFFHVFFVNSLIKNRK